MSKKPCTCWPDDAPWPCARRYAAAECNKVADRRLLVLLLSPMLLGVTYIGLWWGGILP